MLWAILVSSLLLLVGFVLRARMRWLQRLYVPASVTGGVLGLVIVQTLMRIGPPGSGGGDGVLASAAVAADSLASQWRSWPGVLISIVFAGLLLERPNRTLRESARGAGSAAVMVWIIALGEIGLGLAATWLLIMPFMDVPPMFGQLLEAGFAGGHGTAAALGAVHAQLDFADGLDLAMFVATFGLVYSVISGIILVNIAVRRGWTRAGRASVTLVTGLEARRERKPLAIGRVRAEVLDPLAFQLVIVAMAVFAGALMQMAFTAGARELAERVPRLEQLAMLDNVPLFLFTLIGGLVVRRLFELLGVGDLIDPASITRIVAVAMEFLIVAAIASLRIETIAAYLGPIALLLGLGAVWTAFCLLYLSRRLLPAAHWFELGILNYGMSTGTTAQGMMLLRLVDPELESQAAEEYALAAPLSAPFVGGGVLTLALPALLMRVPIGVVVGAIVVAVVVLLLLGRGLRR